MDVNIYVRTSSRIYLPQTRIPTVAIHWGRGTHWEHGAVEEGMACSTWNPMQEVTKNIGRCQIHAHLLCSVHPYLFAVVARAINCQVASIGRELHVQYAIRLRKAKPIAKTSNSLWITHRLPAASLESTSQHKTCRLFKGIVDICRSVRGASCNCISSIRRYLVCTGMRISSEFALEIECCYYPYQ